MGTQSRLRVAGGVGGVANWTGGLAGNFSFGGNGSVGLIRLEDGPAAANPVDFTTLRTRFDPFSSQDPDFGIEFVSVAPGFFDAASVGDQRPDTVSGSSSCWIIPEGKVFRLLFADDRVTGVADPTWTMDVLTDDGSGVVARPFHGTFDDPATSWEEEFGNLLGGNLGAGVRSSPIVVRFQGGRISDSAGIDPCNVDDGDLMGVVAPGSLTPWVAHPADLNVVLDSTGTPYVLNMVRFAILFDRTIDPVNVDDRPGNDLANENVVGVDNLRILAQPE